MSECTPVAHPATISDETATQLAHTLKALADPLRLRMLSAIAADERGESCVCDLTALGTVAQPTVSHHLKILKNAGLVLAERRGTWVYYRLAPQHQRTIRTLISEFTPQGPTP